MKQEEMNTQLYEKLAAEQTKYRDWLMGQPPEEILNHAYEYAVREDILAAAELMDISQAQAAALLAVPSPMEAIYGGWTEQKSPDLSCGIYRLSQTHAGLHLGPGLRRPSGPAGASSVSLSRKLCP